MSARSTSRGSGSGSRHWRSEEHTSELQSQSNLVCRLLLEKKKGHEVYLTASVGISIFPYDGDDSGTILQNASAALYRAKTQGGNNYQFYTTDMNDRALKRLAMETSLRRAVENEEFVLYYQPQIDFGSGKVVGAEALIRWQHPDLGLLPPVEFIPLAEDTGLIVAIGSWVMRQACAQAQSWRQNGLGDLGIAGNVSARQVHQKGFLEPWVGGPD